MGQNHHPIFEYIFNLTQPGVKLELDRIQGFFDEVGHPWESFKCVHIAGTNGKGSTAAITAALLIAQGRRTGLYTSPHLVSPTERIRVNGVRISEAEIIERVTAWKPLIDKYALTFFEVLTALGLFHFQSEGVEYAVLETGLGGRLDATNVVKPELSVITSIDLDHTSILGDNLEDIAAEKGGIIKPGRPVLVGRNTDSVIAVLREQARLQRAPFTLVFDIVEKVSSSYQGLTQQVDVSIDSKYFKLSLPLLGDHQVDNLGNALAALNRLDMRMDPAMLQAGLDNVYWPARMERLSESPLIFYDVAHNPAGVKTLLTTLTELKLKDIVMVAGLNQRKDLDKMLKLLDDWSGPIAFFAFEGHSTTTVSELENAGIPSGLIHPNLDSALTWARGAVEHVESRAICVFGSHYFADELYGALGLELH